MSRDLEKCVEDIISKQQCLGCVSDEDLGLKPPETRQKPRLGVRVVLRNNKGEICMVVSEKHGYMQLPGGGIEEGEEIEDALRRETIEETGYKIADISSLGYFIENRYGSQKNYSFIYSAKITEYVGTDYTDDEKAEGFAPHWLSLKEAIRRQQEMDDELAQQTEKSYNGAFSNRRDLIILHYISNISV